MSDENNCPICFEPIITGNMIEKTLCCKHEFHADCLCTWLINPGRTCPMCRHDIMSDNTQNTLGIRERVNRERVIQQRDNMQVQERNNIVRQQDIHRRLAEINTRRLQQEDDRRQHDMRIRELQQNTSANRLFGLLKDLVLRACDNYKNWYYCSHRLIDFGIRHGVEGVYISDLIETRVNASSNIDGVIEVISSYFQRALTNNGRAQYRISNHNHSWTSFFISELVYQVPRNHLLRNALGYFNLDMASLNFIRSRDSRYISGELGLRQLREGIGYVFSTNAREIRRSIIDQLGRVPIVNTDEFL